MDHSASIMEPESSLFVKLLQTSSWWSETVVRVLLAYYVWKGKTYGLSEDTLFLLLISQMLTVFGLVYNDLYFCDPHTLFDILLVLGAYAGYRRKYSSGPNGYDVCGLKVEKIHGLPFWAKSQFIICSSIVFTLLHFWGTYCESILYMIPLQIEWVSIVPQMLLVFRRCHNGDPPVNLTSQLVIICVMAFGHVTWFLAFFSVLVRGDVVYDPAKEFFIYLEIAQMLCVVFAVFMNWRAVTKLVRHTVLTVQKAIDMV